MAESTQEVQYIATEMTYEGANHRVFVHGTVTRVEDFLFVAGMSLPKMEKRLSVPFASETKLHKFIQKNKRQNPNMEFIDAGGTL